MHEITLALALDPAAAMTSASGSMRWKVGPARRGLHPAPVLRAAAFAAVMLLAPAARAAGYEPHWFFESLSSDGKQALLRELDPENRARFHVRVVDVDSGAVRSDTALPELARVPATTIGGKPTEIAELQWMLASPAFGRDIARGAAIAAAFPFGACGRLAATRSSISFDAGDWLYVADASGRVQRRMSEDASYDPRFTPDGKSLLFRRATAKSGALTSYELFVAPAEKGAEPRALAGTSGLKDRFFPHPDGSSAIAFSSQTKPDRAHETCAISVGLRAPFATRKVACMDEQLVEAVASPRGKYAAVSTKKHGASGLTFRLRVVSLATGKVVSDAQEQPGLVIRAISDRGLLVQSGAMGIVVTDVPAGKQRSIDTPIDLGHRGFFRTEADREQLVYLAGGSVRVLDVSQ